MCGGLENAKECTYTARLYAAFWPGCQTARGSRSTDPPPPPKAVRNAPHVPQGHASTAGKKRTDQKWLPTRRPQHHTHPSRPHHKHTSIPPKIKRAPRRKAAARPAAAAARAPRNSVVEGGRHAAPFRLVLLVVREPRRRQSAFTKSRSWPNLATSAARSDVKSRMSLSRGPNSASSNSLRPCKAAARSRSSANCLLQFSRPRSFAAWPRTSARLRYPQRQRQLPVLLLQHIVLRLQPFSSLAWRLRDAQQWRRLGCRRRASRELQLHVPTLQPRVALLELLQWRS